MGVREKQFEAYEEKRKLKEFVENFGLGENIKGKVVVQFTDGTTYESKSKNIKERVERVVGSLSGILKTSVPKAVELGREKGIENFEDLMKKATILVELENGDIYEGEWEF